MRFSANLQRICAPPSPPCSTHASFQERYLSSTSASPKPNGYIPPRTEALVESSAPVRCIVLPASFYFEFRARPEALVFEGLLLSQNRHTSSLSHARTTRIGKGLCSPHVWRHFEKLSHMLPRDRCCSALSQVDGVANVLPVRCEFLN